MRPARPGSGRMTPARRRDGPATTTAGPGAGPRRSRPARRSRRPPRCAPPPGAGARRARTARNGARTSPASLAIVPIGPKDCPAQAGRPADALRIAPEVDSLLQFLDGLGDAVEVGVDREGAAVTFDRLAQPAE